MASNPTINTRADSHQPFIPEVWANLALDRLRSSMVLSNIVSTDADYGVVNIGDTINIRKRGALVGQAITEGADSIVEQTAGTTIPVALDKTWEVTLGQSDVMKALSDPTGRFMEEYVGDAVQVIAEKIEETLLAEYANFGISSFAGPVDEAKVLTARKNLTDRKAPNMDRYMVVTPEQYNALLAIDRFTAVEKYGPNVSIENGELGRIHGFRVFEHTNIPLSTTYRNMYFHKNAILLAMRELPTPEAGLGAISQTAVDQASGLAVRVTYGYDIRKKQTQVSIDALWGVKTVRPELAGTITSAS